MVSERMQDEKAIFHNKKLEFRHGLILTCDMMEEIYSFPHNLLEIKYKNYSDGIIDGVNYEEIDGNLIITAGMVKFKGYLYLMNENFNLTRYLKTNKFLENSDRLFLYLIPQDKEICESVTIKTLKLYVMSQKENENEGILLGSFRHEENSFLRIPNNIDNFTIKSRIELLEVPFASQRIPTFHPIIFKEVLRFLKKKEKKNSFDWQLQLLLSESETLTLDTISTYITAVSRELLNDEIVETEIDGPSVELFERFVKCLKFKPRELQVPAKEPTPVRQEPLDTRRPRSKSNRYN